MKRFLFCFIVVIVILPYVGFPQDEIDLDLNWRIEYKKINLTKIRDAIKVSRNLGIDPKIRHVIEKFDRNDYPRTKRNMFVLESVINPKRLDHFSCQVVDDGFIRCDFKFAAHTDPYYVRRYSRDWAEYIGQDGFECFVYFIGWIGQLKVCGYEYDPIEMQISTFK